VDFTGRVAVVTGASMGVGRRIALDLARAGAIVVGAARRPEPLAEVEAELRAVSAASWTRPLDVADEAAARALIDDAAGRHGRLDVVVCNAAILGRRPATEIDPAFVREVMDVNLFGTTNCVLPAIPHMVGRGEGWIVGLTSGSGKSPLPGESVYSASKAGMHAFLEAISYELAPKGVRVKVLSPGFVSETTMAHDAVETGLSVPPKLVHRTPEQVSRALLRGLDRAGFEINLTRLENVAVVTRALLPAIYRRSIARRA